MLDVQGRGPGVEKVRPGLEQLTTVNKGIDEESFKLHSLADGHRLIGSTSGGFQSVTVGAFQSTLYPGHILSCNETVMGVLHSHEPLSTGA